MEGVGVNQVYGFSPALDLQALPASAKAPSSESQHPRTVMYLSFMVLTPLNCYTVAGESTNILIAGAADLRHILKTLAFARRHPTKQLNVCQHSARLRYFM